MWKLRSKRKIVVFAILGCESCNASVKNDSGKTNLIIGDDGGDISIGFHDCFNYNRRGIYISHDGRNKRNIPS